MTVSVPWIMPRDRRYSEHIDEFRRKGVFIRPYTTIDTALPHVLLQHSPLLLLDLDVPPGNSQTDTDLEALCKSLSARGLNKLDFYRQITFHVLDRLRTSDVNSKTPIIVTGFYERDNPIKKVLLQHGATTYVPMHLVFFDEFVAQVIPYLKK